MTVVVVRTLTENGRQAVAVRVEMGCGGEEKSIDLARNFH